MDNHINVIVCTYNRAEKLATMLDSLARAELPEGLKVEIIVVDNNSTDSTRSVVEQLEGSESLRFRYLFEPEQGKSYALNTALKNLTGEIIAFTDDDVTVDRNYLANMWDAAVRNPECFCFGGMIDVVYPEAMPEWLDIDGPMTFVKGVFYDRRDGDREALYEELDAPATPSGGNMFFRRLILEENGPFRTDLGPIGRKLGFSEDTEYCRRVLERGYRFRYIPSVIIHHPIDPERLSPAYISAWQFQCGKSEAMRHSAIPCPRIFGVPRFLFIKLLSHLSGWVFSAESRMRFYHRLRLVYNWGQILGYLQKKA